MICLLYDMSSLQVELEPHRVKLLAIQILHCLQRHYFNQFATQNSVALHLRQQSMAANMRVSQFVLMSK